MSMLASALGRQLARPSGWGGAIVERAMRIANRRATVLAIDALGVRPGDTVLDLGCGSGDAIPALRQLAGHGDVYGVDHAADMIASARRRHPGASFAQATFRDLPFSDQRVDRILAANVAYFWHDHRPVLRELTRVLRPGGRIALYVTRASALRRAGLGRSGTHRLFEQADLAGMLGPHATIVTVDAGFGVTGLIATLDR